MPDREKRLCQNCGHTYDTHQTVMGGPIQERIVCPTGTKFPTTAAHTFAPSGWYEGTPQEQGFGFMLFEHEVIVTFVGLWDKVNGPVSVRYFPLVSLPTQVPIQKD